MFERRRRLEAGGCRSTSGVNLGAGVEEVVGASGGLWSLSSFCSYAQGVGFWPCCA